MVISVLAQGADWIQFDVATFAEQFWNSTIDGLTYGAIYALIALGYTLVYGVLRLINFAHSEVFMVGAFAVFFTLCGARVRPVGAATRRRRPDRRPAVAGARRRHARLRRDRRDRSSAWPTARCAAGARRRWSSSSPRSAPRSRSST